MSIYLDWNATAPPHPEVLAAVDEARRTAWANPSSVHAAGRRARDRVETVREQLARILGFDARDVVFTGGGTEANHLAVSGASHLVTSRLEHPSLALHAEYLEGAGAKVAYAGVDPDGYVTAQAVEEALSQLLPGEGEGRRGEPGTGPEAEPRRIVVCVMAANHETGVLQPIADIAQVTRRWGAHLHVDAVQLLGRGELAALALADSVAVTSHKIRGPHGVGALAFVCGWTPRPLGRGGAQERGLRPGTLDAVSVAGFGAALDRLGGSVARYQALGQLRDELERELDRRTGGRITFHGRGVPRLAHVTNFALPGWRGDELVAALDLAGIQISSGSACSAGTAEPSPVIEAMVGRDRATRAVRVSFGEESTPGDAAALLAALERLGALAHP